MTALTVPARAEKNGGLRPLPWRRIAWVTWRQHRLALVSVAGLLTALTIWMWIVGLKVHHAYAAVTACHPASSAVCGDLYGNFIVMEGFLSNGIIPQLVPVLVGAFVGAPVLAREMETGTFRFAWTQGFGRWRWALAKLVLLAAFVTVGALLFSLLLNWYYQPYFASGDETPLAPLLFNLRGVAFAAWTLTAFSIGALAGMLIRRVVPAIVTTLVIYVGLAFAAGGYLRAHYLTPVVTHSLTLPGSAWIVNQWWTKGGQFAWSGRPPANVLNHITCNFAGPGKPTFGSLEQCVAAAGYTPWIGYQPASRFWTFQWIEGGWLLALSVLLIAATIWLVRRRAA